MPNQNEINKKGLTEALDSAPRDPDHLMEMLEEAKERSPITRTEPPQTMYIDIECGGIDTSIYESDDCIEQIILDNRGHIKGIKKNQIAMIIGSNQHMVDRTRLMKGIEEIRKDIEKACRMMQEMAPSALEATKALKALGNCGVNLSDVRIAEKSIIMDLLSKIEAPRLPEEYKHLKNIVSPDKEIKGTKPTHSLTQKEIWSNKWNTKIKRKI